MPDRRQRRFAGALREAGVAEAVVKWPNDLVWRQRKLGGLLLQLRSEAGGPASVVAGLGLLYAFALRDLMTLDAYLWASAGVFVVAAAAVYLHLRRSGAERFESLAA